MRKIFIALLVLCPVLLFASPSEEAERLVEIFGWKELYKDVITVPGWTDLSKEERKQFEANTDYDSASLVKSLALWLDREFDPDERKDILRFLESEVGQKFSEIFFQDREGTGEIHEVVGAWITGRHHDMNAYLNER